MAKINRDQKGRIIKGSRSLNPRGRPVENTRTFTSDQLTKDFLGLLDEPVSVIIGGKERQIPAIMAIYRKMVHLAAGGDWPAIKKTVELREKYINARTDTLGRMLEHATEIRRYYEERDESIPDHIWGLVDDAERAVQLGQFRPG